MLDEERLKKMAEEGGEKVPISTRIAPRAALRLKRKAARENISMSGFLRALILEALEAGR